MSALMLMGFPLIWGNRALIGLLNKGMAGLGNLVYIGVNHICSKVRLMLLLLSKHFWWYAFLLTESNSFISLILSNTTFCTLFASTLCIHIKPCSLLISLVSLKAVSSFIISTMVVSSSRWFINCSFSLGPWFAIYPFTPGQTPDFCFQLSVLQEQYCSLWCCLNFHLVCKNSLSTVLHASFPKLRNVNCSPYLPSQFFNIRTFSSSVNSYVWVWSIFTTCISNTDNAVYLSVAFQLIDGCLKAGLSYLCLSASSEVTGLVPGICFSHHHHWCHRCLGNCLHDYHLDWFWLCHFSMNLYFCLSETFTPDTM